MAQSDRSSRGKRRERRSSEDETQSISLSEYHASYLLTQTYSQYGIDTLPQSPQQVVYQTQEDPYSQSSNYYLAPDHQAYYPTTSPASGLEGYDGYATSMTGSRPSRSASDIWDASGPASGFEGYNDYATSVASSRPSGPASDIWDLQSLSTVLSATTTAPPRYSRDNVDSHINAQRPTAQRYELPCEFRGCGVVFHGDEEVDWITHMEDHLGGTFPSKLRCWFNCEFGLFDAQSPEMGGNTRNNFQQRMLHIRDHILHDGSRPHDRIVDGFLLEHLRKKGMIDEKAYRDWLKPSQVPPIVGSSRSGGNGSSEFGNSRHRHQGGYTQFAVVEEDGAPSSSRDQRYEKKSEKKEHRRDSHNRKRSTK